MPCREAPQPIPPLAGPSLAPSPVLAAPPATVAQMEQDLILATLERLGGNRTHAARALGISVRTIRNRLRDYRTASAGAGRA